MCDSRTQHEGSLHLRACAVGHEIRFWAQCSDYPYKDFNGMEFIFAAEIADAQALKPCMLAEAKR